MAKRIITCHSTRIIPYHITAMQTAQLVHDCMPTVILHTTQSATSHLHDPLSLPQLHHHHRLQHSQQHSCHISAMATAASPSQLCHRSQSYQCRHSSCVDTQAMTLLVHSKHGSYVNYITALHHLHSAASSSQRCNKRCTQANNEFFVRTVAVSTTKL